MLCPNENREMQPVKAESHYGQTVVLDQCPGCGGIWFDSFELYMAKQGQADKIELLDVDSLQSSSAIQKSDLLCPRDQSKLVHFSDPVFPKDLILARCPVCGGFWLNRGEFTKYQHYRQERQEANKPKEILIEDGKFERDVARVWQENQTKDPTEMLGKLGSFLSTPVDTLSWRPLEPEKLSDKEKTAYSLITTALSLILRFFVRI